MNLRFSRLLPIVCFAASILIAGCQKEVTSKLPDETETISSDNPKTFSAAIKVWHGTRVQGAAPAPSGNSLELEPFANTTVKAFAGRYATIKPEIVSGDVEGYYVGIAGSGEYFKVDYSKPRNIAGRVGTGKRKPNNPFVPNGVDSTGGNLDSSLVIVLPPNISVPDTFCVTYCAYDAAGNVSQPVTTCIIVSSLGGDAASGWINGDWKFTASWEGNEPHDTVIYNKWTADQDYYCRYDSVTNASYISANYNNLQGVPIIVSDSIFYKKLNLNLSSNGAQQFVEDMLDKYLNHPSSTCQQFVFEPVSSYSDAMIGGWSFNSATNKITLIFESDYSGQSVVEAWEYDVVKVSNNQFIMVDTNDPTFPYFMRLEK